MPSSSGTSPSCRASRWCSPILVVLVNLLADMAYAFARPESELRPVIDPDSGGQIFAPAGGGIDRTRPPGRSSRARGHAEPHWYRQPALMAGLVITGIIIAMAIAAPLITFYNPIAQNLNDTLQGPSAQHWLGTDQLGRDIWTRLVYGARVDLRVGVHRRAVPVLPGHHPRQRWPVYFGGWADAGDHAAGRRRGRVPVLRAADRAGVRARSRREQHLHRDHRGRLGLLRPAGPRRDPGGQTAGIRARRPRRRPVQPAHHGPAPDCRT